jgi:hypothetical protein
LQTAALTLLLFSSIRHSAGEAIWTAWLVGAGWVGSYPALTIAAARARITPGADARRSRSLSWAEATFRDGTVHSPERSGSRSPSCWRLWCLSPGVMRGVGIRMPPLRRMASSQHRASISVAAYHPVLMLAASHRYAVFYRTRILVPCSSPVSALVIWETCLSRLLFGLPRMRSGRPTSVSWSRRSHHVGLLAASIQRRTIPPGGVGRTTRSWDMRDEKLRVSEPLRGSGARCSLRHMGGLAEIGATRRMDQSMRSRDVCRRLRGGQVNRGASSASVRRAAGLAGASQAWYLRSSRPMDRSFPSLRRPSTRFDTWNRPSPSWSRIRDRYIVIDGVYRRKP